MGYADTAVSGAMTTCAAYRHRDVVVQFACTEQVVLHHSLGQHSGAVR